MLTRDHGLIHARRPIDLSRELELRLSRTPVDGLHCARMPAVHITSRNDDLHHVIAVLEAQLYEGCAERRSSRSSQAEGEHSHGNHTSAFSPVDVGLVGREDIRRRLGCVWLESHCEVV